MGEHDHGPRLSLQKLDQGLRLLAAEAAQVVSFQVKRD
jgi:hypothetical protein